MTKTAQKIQFNLVGEIADNISKAQQTQSLLLSQPKISKKVNQAILSLTDQIAEEVERAKNAKVLPILQRLLR